MLTTDNVLSLSPVRVYLRSHTKVRIKYYFLLTMINIAMCAGHSYTGWLDDSCMVPYSYRVEGVIV